MVDFPTDVKNDCRKKNRVKGCDALFCGFESAGVLINGSLVKEKFIEAFELGVETDYPSSKEALNPLLPKAFEACEPLGMNEETYLFKDLKLLFLFSQLRKSLAA